MEACRGEREGDGVGGVIRCGHGAEAEERLHHDLNLALVSPAVPGDARFYLLGREFPVRQTVAGEGEQDDPARVADVKCGLDVF